MMIDGSKRNIGVTTVETMDGKKSHPFRTAKELWRVLRMERQTRQNNRQKRTARE
jgi:hypothetical protein